MPLAGLFAGCALRHANLLAGGAICDSLSLFYFPFCTLELRIFACSIPCLTRVAGRGHG